MSIRALIPKENIQETYHLDIGTLFICEDYVTIEAKEGVTLDYKSCEILVELLLFHFGKEKPFGYIVNRINSYSILPTELKKVKNYFSPESKVAIVTYNELGKLTAQFEQEFWPYLSKTFDKLSDALAWVSPNISKSNLEVSF